MAIARKTSGVRPLETAIVDKRVAGATIVAGQVVALQNDGFVDPADTTAAVANGLGVALTDANAGGTVDVVVYGRVLCVTGATPAAVVHASDNAGEPAEAAGSNAGVLGYALTSEILFVAPQLA